MATAKVTVNGTPIIDLTDATATADKILAPYTAYGADGSKLIGTASGGGNSALITGTFTTSSTSGGQYVDIPYTGSGYPILVEVEVEGGYQNPESDYHTLVQQYAVGAVLISKNIKGVAPTWSMSVDQNNATVISVFKNSISDPTVYSNSRSIVTPTFSDSSASANATQCVRFTRPNRMSVYVASTSYGLKDSMTYTYRILYSS